MKKKVLTFLGLLLFAPIFGQLKSDVIKSDVIDIVVESNKMVSPDLVKISMDLYYNDKQEQVALNMLNSGLKEQLKAIVKVGIQEDKIKLSRFRIRELSESESGKRKVTGYQAFQNIIITISSTDKQQIDKLLSGITINKKDNIKFQVDAFLSDSLISTTKNELIKKGISDAKVKAQIISDELKIKLGTIKMVNYGSDDSYDSYSTSVKFTAPIVFDEVQEEESAYDNFDINEVKVEDQIHIVWNIQ
jgi:uncharacterized protein YggE